MAGRQFRYFVVFADMRTGSNYLEENINLFPDLTSYGELFNPHFVGGPKKDNMFGIDLGARQKDPITLLDAMCTANPDEMPGFRFFGDHDPRVLARCLEDRDCAKVILTRNPLDSYVSRKIAAVTNQWRLTNVKHQKTAMIDFDAQEFSEYLERLQEFQLRLLNGLQTSGQTAFYINYDDIGSLDVINGLARFLGSNHQIPSLSRKLKKQNPASLESKVANFVAMIGALGDMDLMGLNSAPSFEPRRGASVPQYVAGDKAALLFMPIKAAPGAAVVDWIKAHETALGGAALLGEFSQKSLREWLRSRRDFQSITVVRHPVARAYFAFCTYILPAHQATYQDIRKVLIREFKIGIPKNDADATGYDLAAHKAAFLDFLGFLKKSLAGQTNLRVDAAWASQSAVLKGFSGVMSPMHIVKEQDLATTCAYIEDICGFPGGRKIEAPELPFAPFSLSQIYDPEIEKKTREIYVRDYLNFGFGDWEG
ncbi:MAG: sulfotransferase domain-containing protein [Alphaproteobacteria bacterium]|nr:sulfotransferase domain-containing protein [Alphaproteobacteria bacterium]